MHTTGSDSPKLLTSPFGNSANGFTPLTSAAAHHALNLAAFRSPGFLGAHGFAFGAAHIENYRDHSPESFVEHPSPTSIHNHNNNNNNNPNSANSLSALQQNYSTNSNSPTNKYSSARSSPPTRDGYLSSDYYHNNNTTTASAIKAAIESHQNNSDYISSERHLTSQKSIDSNLNNNLNSSSGALANINRRINFDRTSPDSPETQRCDSSRSYPTSQKSDEGDYYSPTHPDSVGSRSPDHLSSATATKKSNNMLDHHKLPLSFLGPPLAALHSMTEMKSANVNSAVNTSSSNSIQQTQSQLNSHGTANPHGIDTILSRPPPVTTAGLNALTSGMALIFI